MGISSIIIFSSLVLFSISNASKPKAFIFPIKKDETTNQYYTSINIGHNITTLNVVVDLGGKFLWFNSNAYVSATSAYRPISCDTPQCAIIDQSNCLICHITPFRRDCYTDVCTSDALNPFTGTRGYSGLGQDVLHVISTRGVRYDLKKFPFQFSDPVLLQGLARQTSGLIGLGRSKSALPAQLSSRYRTRENFTLCLPSSGNDGSMIIGEGNYISPFKDISKSLITTPLIKNNASTLGNEIIGNMTNEYFINVKSIRVDNKILPLNKSLLSIVNNTGEGGTSLRTVRSYTGLHRSIYLALVNEFVKAASSKNITRVASVAPFGACFDAKTIVAGKTGPEVPVIDLVLQSKKVYWRFYGSNSIVKVSADVACLAFVEEPRNIVGPTTSIVVGGYQMENYLLQFDVDSSRLAFSTLLLLQDTSCSQFIAS